MWHYWSMKKCIQGFGWEDMREGDYLEDPGLDGRIILKWIPRSGMGEHGLDCSSLE